MRHRDRIADELRGKGVCGSDGVPPGKIMPSAKCGRVMGFEDLSRIPPTRLQLDETMYVTRDESLRRRYERDHGRSPGPS